MPPPTSATTWVSPSSHIFYIRYDGCKTKKYQKERDREGERERARKNTTTITCAYLWRRMYAWPCFYYIILGLLCYNRLVDDVIRVYYIHIYTHIYRHTDRYRQFIRRGAYCLFYKQPFILIIFFSQYVASSLTSAILSIRWYPTDIASQQIFDIDSKIRVFLRLRDTMRIMYVIFLL